MARSRINNTCFETVVDVQAKKIDLDLSAQADQVQVPSIDFGNTGPGARSVDDHELLWFEHMSCDQQVSLKSTLNFLQNFLWRYQQMCLVKTSI